MAEVVKKEMWGTGKEIEKVKDACLSIAGVFGNVDIGLALTEVLPRERVQALGFLKVGWEGRSFHLGLKMIG